MRRVSLVVVTIGLFIYLVGTAGLPISWASGNVQIRESSIKVEQEQLRLSFWIANNTGEYVRPDVRVEATNMQGDKIVDILIENEIGLIPGEERLLTARWATEPIMIGKLRVEFTVISGDVQNHTITDFWLLPQSINIVAIGISLLATGRASNWVLTRLA